MLESMTYEEAVSAIQSDIQSEETPETSTEELKQADNTEVPPDIEGASSTPEDSDVPTWSLNINDLPEEVKPFAKSVQADYTRKTQALAELRKQYDGFGDPEDVAQAVALARAFQADPIGTLKQVETGLREMGLVLANTDTEPPKQQPDPVLAKLRETYEEDDPLYQLALQLNSGLKDLQSEREQFQKERQDAEKARTQREQEEYFSKAEIGIRSAHQDWTDDDISNVYDIVLATGGDMEEAAKRYDEIGTRFLTRYLSRKTGLPKGSSALPASGPGQAQVETPKTFSEATKRAKEELEALTNLGEFNISDFLADD